jgi:hypothetical protein
MFSFAPVAGLLGVVLGSADAQAASSAVEAVKAIALNKARARSTWFLIRIDILHFLLEI